MLKACCDCVFGTPTKDQQQTKMDNEMYGKPNSNDDGSFQFLLPTTLKINDCLKVKGLLRDNPRTVILSLVTGNYNGPDYSNVALQFSVNILDGDESDTFTLSSILDNTREVFHQEAPGGKLFMDSKFEFDVNIVEDPESEEGSHFTFFSSDSAMGQSTFKAKHNLGDVKYLILTGDYQKVQRLQFDFA